MNTQTRELLWVEAMLEVDQLMELLVEDSKGRSSHCSEASGGKSLSIRTDLSQSTWSCAANMVPEDHRSIVSETWQLVKQRKELGDIGIAIFDRYFKENPDHLTLFPVSGSSESGNLKENIATFKHTFKVIYLFDRIFMSINQGDWYVPILRYIGASHGEFATSKIGLSFDNILDGLRAEVKSTLAEEFRSDVELAWLQVTRVLYSPIAIEYSNVARQYMKGSKIIIRKRKCCFLM